MTLEGLGGGELTELVADHGVVYIHRHMLPAVMHGESMPNEVGENGGTTGPGFNDLLGTLFVLSINLCEEVLIDKTGPS